VTVASAGFIRKLFAPHSSPITRPEPHHSICYRWDVQLTVSIHWRI